MIAKMQNVSRSHLVAVAMAVVALPAVPFLLKGLTGSQVEAEEGLRELTVEVAPDAPGTFNFAAANIQVAPSAPPGFPTGPFYIQGPILRICE